MAVGALTVAKLWMRPVGAVGAGVIGDSLDRGKVLAGLLVLGSILLAALALVPFGSPVALLLAIMLIVGLVTCAVRGVY